MQSARNRIQYCMRLLKAAACCPDMGGCQPAANRGFHRRLSVHTIWHARLRVAGPFIPTERFAMPVKLPSCSSAGVRSLPLAGARRLRRSPASAQENLKLGLVAAMSGQSAKSGEAIVRGLSHRRRRDQRQGRRARQEGRAAGARRREQPGQGRDRRARAGAAREGRGPVRRARHAGLDRHRAVRQQRQGAVHGRVGGGHADHPNGAAENYVFRVSAVDELVDIALVDYAVAKYGAKKPGMILINNSWGESNEKGLKAALDGQEACPTPASRSSRPTMSTWCRSSRASRRRAPTRCSWSPTSRPPRRW